MLYNRGMKKKLLYIVMSLNILITGLATFPLVRAEETMEVTTTSENADSETKEDSVSESKKEARQKRVEEYKKKLKETLSSSTKTRISEKCVAAQALVKVHHGKSEVAFATRTKAYATILTKLEAAAASLKEAGKDVSALEANITELKTKVEGFKSLITTYQESLDDLAELECKNDPTAFKAALETARTNQKAAQDSAKEIRKYLTEVVKPTLKTLKENEEKESE
jgi:hypothetical protein